jgi:RsiW-degrading membrane proteinase PrsW (M82 family)
MSIRPKMPRESRIFILVLISIAIILILLVFFVPRVN